ncbi:MAG TPA: DUF4239 domain-containing protein [Geobacteraceae bacterium]|nr:DUF4239 domain-containing protein [Geobacteraceae bacterium]
MSALLLALIAFACIFGGALLGLCIHSYLPDHHLSENGRDIVKLGAGLIATLAALVLGLLVSSAKSSLDSINSELTQDSAKVIVLDRALAAYGPETKEIRDLLRLRVESAIKRIWPEVETGNVTLETPEAARGLEAIQEKLRELRPGNSSQHQLQSQALQIVADLAQSRWLVIEQTQTALPPLFLVILIIWLSMLFACFGLLSPVNATVVVVLLMCALSVSTAIFLINEMNTPATGLIKVSSAPLRNALDHLGK